MNFVWLDVNSSWSHSSLALPALHSQLSTKQLSCSNWSVVRATIKSPIEEIIEELIESKPDYIFATCWLFNISFNMQVLSRISSLLTIKGIFLGGPEFLGDNKEFLLNNSFVTAVFRGEGEDIFPEFIEQLITKENRWRELPGFEYIENNIYCKKDSVVSKKFIEIPPPESSSFFNWDKSFIQLETSRGCFNSCRFCVSGIDSSPILNREIKDLRERLNIIVKRGIKEIRILDRTFNANTKRSIELLSLFNEYHNRLRFHIEVHPALLSIEFKSFLNTIPRNLLHIEAGIQSLRDNVLEICKRKGSNKQAIEGLKYLIDSKFIVHADLIVGLPDYTLQSLIEDTRELILISPDEIQIELLKLLPGTYFRDNAEVLQIKYSPLPPYEVLSTQAINYKELRVAQTLSKIIDYWYNYTPLKALFTKIVKENIEFLNNYLLYSYSTQFFTQPSSLESKLIFLFNYIKEYYPKYISLYALWWVENGFSIKKGAGLEFTMWEYNSNIENPIFEPLNRRYKYYYLKENNRYLFIAYNNDIVRDKIIKYKWC